MHFVNVFLIKNGKEIWVGICCSCFSKKLIDTVHYIDVLIVVLCLYKCYSSRENQSLVTTRSFPFLHLTLRSTVPGDSRRATDSLDVCQSENRKHNKMANIWHTQNYFGFAWKIYLFEMDCEKGERILS
jgi:hypothetical protein